MNPDAGRAWFRIALTITLVSAVLVYFTEPGTAERVVSVITLLIGLYSLAPLSYWSAVTVLEGGDWIK